MTGSALPGLTTAALGRRWEHFESIGSTNDYLKQNAGALPHGYAVTAAEQTSGKGRLGRAWTAEPGSCMALSVLLRDYSPDKITALPLLAGLAVAEGIEALCGAACQLKWSNDVLVAGKKLCGILCESRISSAGGFAVVGIGVNLTQSAADFDRLGLVYATSLFMATGKLYPMAETAAAVLNRLEPLLEEYLVNGLEPLLNRYKRRCVTLGKAVRVLYGGEGRTGTALDIAPDGSLICELDGELFHISAGEASVRGLYGYT